MKKILSLFSFMLFATVLLNSCRNPAYEMNVLFDAEFIKYSVALSMRGANGEALPNNISVTIEGDDAASIYDYTGTKAIKVAKVNADLAVSTIGVTPKAIPVGSSEVNFNVIITAPGYEPKNIPVEMVEGQFRQALDVTLLQSVKPTEASTVLNRDIALTNGSNPTQIVLTTPTSATVQTSTTVTIPAGNKFFNAANQELTGSTLALQVINFDASDPFSIDLFPAGTLNSKNVTDETGKLVEAFFVPAAFADVKMFLNGQRIRRFATPITISLQLDPNYIMADGEKVKVGDKLPVYSYHVEEGDFDYHVEGTVANDASGKLSVTFTTDHLTIFIVGEVFIKTENCVAPTLTFSAPWLGTANPPAQQEMTLTIFDATNTTKELGSSLLPIRNGYQVTLDELPTFAVKYQLKNNAGKVVAEGIIGDPCAGGNISVAVGQPDGPVLENVTLTLNVNCPEKGKIIVPVFDLWYRPVGTTEFMKLGTTSNGAISTTLLKVGATYDFRGVWGDQVKTVNKKTISSLDLSTTVEANGFIGDNAPVSNRALLIEACKK